MKGRKRIVRAGWAGLLVLSLVASSCATTTAWNRTPAENPRVTSHCETSLTGLRKFSFHESLSIPPDFRHSVKELMLSYGVSPQSAVADDYFEVVNAVYTHLYTSGGTSLEQGDRMAEFGEKLDAWVDLTNGKLRKAVWFMVGWAVANFEAYRLEEFKVANESETHVVHRYTLLSSHWETENNPTGLVHFKDYPRYAKSFVQKNGAYKKHMVGRPSLFDATETVVNGATVRVGAQDRTALESGGILSFTAYRDIVSHNMWPLYVEHDMQHIHFAYGHGRGVSLVFRSARSYNHLRFVMMGAMYEGVDTVQFSHESGLARYFSETMQMGLEDSLLWIAKSTVAGLKKVMMDARIERDVNGYVSQLSSYRPSIKEGYDGSGVTGAGLENELFDFIELSEAHSRDPQYAPFTNYHRSAPDAGGSTWDKDFAHYNSMRTMRGPNNRLGNTGIPGSDPRTIPLLGPVARSITFNLRGFLRHFGLGE